LGFSPRFPAGSFFDKGGKSPYRYNFQKYFKYGKQIIIRVIVPRLFLEFKMKGKFGKTIIAGVVSIASLVNYSGCILIRPTDYSPFKDRQEFLGVANDYEKQEVKDGEWSGLKLRKIKGSNLEATLMGINPGDCNI